MPQLTEDYLRERSVQLLEEKIQDANIFDPSKEEKVPILKSTEIDFGRILGTGGFCTVSALHDVKLALGESEEASEAKEQVSSENDFFMIIQDREYIANNYIRESDGKHRYAIKKLTPGLYAQGDLQHFVCGVIDLAMEVKFLSILRHPHIIKMRGMANVGYCHKDFFILLDRLNSTMSGQIKTWKKELPSGAFVANKKQKKEELFCERLMVGYDMCSAIAYLHERKIVYRDLKPDNIGFDVRDDVKIFDFGLACEMTEERRIEGTQDFLLTKDTGSPRYMAPEVYKGVPYNEKCDVYSYGLILWQCLELAVPFEKLDLNQMGKQVYRGKLTPKVNPKWSSNIKAMISNTWLRDHNKRASCTQIMEVLRGEIEEMDGDAMGQLDISNRTEMSMKNLRV